MSGRSGLCSSRPTCWPARVKASYNRLTEARRVQCSNSPSHPNPTHAYFRFQNERPTKITQTRLAGYSTVQGPSTSMVRPHPAVWRLVHGVVVSYLLLLVWLLFQVRIICLCLVSVANGACASLPRTAVVNCAASATLIQRKTCCCAGAGWRSRPAAPPVAVPAARAAAGAQLRYRLPPVAAERCRQR